MGPNTSEKNKIIFLFIFACPGISGGSETYVFKPEMVMVLPTGVPVCLTPLKQHSPGGPASVALGAEADMGVVRVWR